MVLEEHKKIIILESTANGSSRPEISKLADCSTVTVWKYQKKFGLL